MPQMRLMASGRSCADCCPSFPPEVSCTCKASHSFTSHSLVTDLQQARSRSRPWCAQSSACRLCAEDHATDEAHCQRPQLRSLLSFLPARSCWRLRCQLEGLSQVCRHALEAVINLPSTSSYAVCKCPMPHGTVDAGFGTSGKTFGKMMQKNDFADAENTRAMTRSPMPVRLAASWAKFGLSRTDCMKQSLRVWSLVTLPRSPSEA